MGAVRIIAGTHRSRLLHAPQGMATRPTSGRLRETLFNVLGQRLDGARFLDLYAGSGAHGLEALSRGADRAVLVEQAPAAVTAIRANVTALGLGAQVQVAATAVHTWLAGAIRSCVQPFDMILLDPPWDAAEEYAVTLDLLGGHGAVLLAAGGTVVAEHRRRAGLLPRYGGLEQSRVLEQGDAALSFYRRGGIEG